MRVHAVECEWVHYSLDLKTQKAEVCRELVVWAFRVVGGKKAEEGAQSETRSATMQEPARYHLATIGRLLEGWRGRVRGRPGVSSPSITSPSTISHLLIRSRCRHILRYLQHRPAGSGIVRHCQAHSSGNVWQPAVESLIFDPPTQAPEPAAGRLHAGSGSAEEQA